MARRALISIRRTVPPADAGAYQSAWERLQASAVRAGAKAWRFRSAAEEGRFIEFLEFPMGADPRALPETAEALRLLDRLRPGDAEEWVDTSTGLEEGR